MKYDYTASCTPNDTGTLLLFDPDAKMNYLILCIVFSIIEVQSLILNGCFLRIFFQDRDARRQRSKVLLVLLVISDLTTCIVVIPVYIIVMYLRSRGYLACQLTVYIKCSGMASVLMTLVGVVVISVDLYVAIVKPYRYNQKDGIARIICITVCIWGCIFTSAGLSMYVLQVWKLYGVIASLITFTLFGFIFYFHIRINQEISNMSSKEIIKSYDRSKARLSNTLRKTFQTATAIVIIFILVYIPSIIMIVYRLSLKPAPFFNTYIFHWFSSITLSSVLWNPILYYYRMKSVRKKLYKALCCFCKR